MHNAIFIFRRDFRLYDNTALIEALKNSEYVIPIFIFTPEQIRKNSFKSNNSVQFMIESLEDLEKQLKDAGGILYYFYGIPYKICEKLIKNKKLNIGAIYVNADYTPYSIKRDASIKKICDSNNISFKSFEDITLNKLVSPLSNDSPPSQIIKTDAGETYTKFTPYFRKARQNKINKPRANTGKNYYTNRDHINDAVALFKGDKHRFYIHNPNLWRNGGRINGLATLRAVEKSQQKYNTTRNLLSRETTNLSAFLKYGCISIREVYWHIREKLGTRTDLIKQLYWRDFYYNIMYSFPHVLKTNLKPQYDKLKWINNSAWLKRWEEGKTGFPIVDAGMRQMNATGYMHNRARLITASFLIKLLHIDWRKGEKYFSRKLYDIDVSQNNGNFGWVSSTGADSQPYFRIFNPWAQSVKHDPDCEYIKKWIPELTDVPAKDIHTWFATYQKYPEIKYYSPMIDYNKERKKSIAMYRRIY